MNPFFRRISVAFILALTGCATLREPVTGPLCMRQLNEIGDKLIKEHGQLTETRSVLMDKIRQTIELHRDDFKACFLGHVRKVGKEAGRMKASFIIEARGEVVKSCITETTYADTEFQRCVLNSLDIMQFPALQGVTQVSYPFDFSP
jgi:hypothetical protein